VSTEKEIPLKTRALLACLASLVLSWIAPALPAHAQPFPSRPVRLIVPFAAGSGVDIVARIVGDGLAAQLHQPVVVENREGAAGMIGSQLVAHQPADGYTVLAVPNTFLITPQLLRTGTFDPVREFSAVARVASVPFVLVTSAESRFNSMKDLIAYMKENPGKVSYATSGKGAQSQLEVEYINQALGLKAVDVPYKTSGASIADTVSNVVSFYMTGIGSVAPSIAAGKLRALAVGTTARIPSLPDVPTFIEATGIADYVPTSWFGFVVRAGTPPEIQARLEEAIVRVAATAAVRDGITKAGNVMTVASGRQFGTEMAAEAQKWARLINVLNLKAD
jgi:tripartite-type tricarboxylate transporter receptor subunit TctC